MKYIAFVLIVFLMQDVPFKPKEEFEIKLDYQFKHRPTSNHAWVAAETVADNSNSVLPYLVLNVKVLKISNEEVRLRIKNNKEAAFTNKKITEGSIIPIELGFTDDVKDRVTAHDYTLTFINPDKVGVSLIHILIDSDGSFYVNDERRGKF
jgi:hypothetical protein